MNVEDQVKKIFSNKKSCMKINLNIKYILGIVPLLVVSCTSLDEEPVSNQVTTQFYTD
jgi:hypothetical protein